MPYFEVAFEDVGFTNSPRSSENALSLNQAHQLKVEERHERLLPKGFITLIEAYSTPDDAQGSRNIKVFTPVRLLVEAASEEEAEAMEPPTQFLDKVVGRFANDISLEGNWEVTDVTETSMEYPSLRWLVSELRNNPVSRVDYKVLGAYVVGSEAKGTARPDSDLDIAVIIPESSRVSALKRTERYHAKFTTEAQKATWGGRRVDIQFFYPNDPELAGNTKLPISLD